jgi:hypothetical protein
MSESLMRSLERVATPTPTTDSHTRTHTRTENLPTEVEHLSVRNAQAYDGLELIGDVLNRPSLSAERHPRIREGERAPIPWRVRAAVWFRDNGRCEFCQASAGKDWELDHIIPWSAGGPDTTPNLRVLCRDHNQERSNYASHDDARARMAATWWCDRCYGLDVKPWFYGAEGRYVDCPIHTFRRKVCAVTRNYDWGLDQEEWTPWHQRQQVLEPTLTAYCAHCRMPGVTDVVL